MGRASGAQRGARPWRVAAAVAAWSGREGRRNRGRGGGPGRSEAVPPTVASSPGGAGPGQGKEDGASWGLGLALALRSSTTVGEWLLLGDSRIGSRAGAAGAAAALGGGEEQGASGVGKDGTGRGASWGRPGGLCAGAGGRRGAGGHPARGDGEDGAVEILRKFIQRVQAMKVGPWEDNFARDFMVSPSPRCCLLSPASKPTASSPARPDRGRAVYGCKERGGGRRASPKGQEVDSEAGR